MITVETVLTLATISAIVAALAYLIYVDTDKQSLSDGAIKVSLLGAFLTLLLTLIWSL